MKNEEIWLRRKIRRWLSGLVIIGILSAVSGCSSEVQMEKLPLDIYQEAAEAHRLSDLETVRRIVYRFGENGYAAVDSENRIDMVQSQKVLDFCTSVADGKESDLSLIQVSYHGGFSVYGFHTRDGLIDVEVRYYGYENGDLIQEESGSYQAKSWRYTEDGYLMVSGTYFSEELYALTLSDAEEYLAFRVQPLDETCREFNEAYLLPIGYKENNMFLVDWSEDDFGEMNFYDLYDIFNPKTDAGDFLYSADESTELGPVYHIPGEDFERVIMPYFHMDRDTLQLKTVYDSVNETYEYRPRGFYETEYPDYPYPEVVGYQENPDGTITLTIHAVFPYYGNSNVYTHEVTVRPLGENGVQYVSNEVITPVEKDVFIWHTPRLTTGE